MASKRKPFKQDGWAVIATGIIDCLGDTKKDAEINSWSGNDAIPVTVRERLPACKHEGKTVLATGVLWCSDCGAARKFGDTRWRKPRRA